MMYFADDISGKKYSKDPAVVKFKGEYYMYYSLPPYGELEGWSIGIAKSDDLENWTTVKRMLPKTEDEKKGFCAPGAIVFGDKVHMFYQSYGGFWSDKIKHAVSEDGINFTREEEPIFAPNGDWTCGRAIDADVIAFGDKMLMYFATRDPEGKIQKLGVCSAPLESDFSKGCWTRECNKSILEPELEWEKMCIEAPAVCEHDGKIYMFYGGAYNNEPQQIGCAVSEDGINFKRLSDAPFVKNGEEGEWNSSESGHPFAFCDDDGKYYLFYQGNNDYGQTWYLSQKKFTFENGMPVFE